MNHISDIVPSFTEAELKAIRRRSLEHQLRAKQTEMITISREIVRLERLVAEAA